MIAALAPLPVALPLAIAALLLIFAHLWPARLPDAIATVTALGVTAVCALMVPHVATPYTYWFGGWQPAGGPPLGIDFVIDRFGAGMGMLIGVLFAGTFVFAWGYFESVHAHFHVLMLLFLAGLLGFSLTHDLFNMFVWFEVMGVAAFALTGYQLEASALEGGLNFTVVNGVGGYLMLCGIGLIYARAGALDFGAMRHAIASHQGDPVIAGAFCLVVTALLIKGAIVPFQYWLSDAHAVAPSPVSVIFSGCMVSIAIYGIARLYWQVFDADTEIAGATHRVLLAAGSASALIGAIMCARQRHLKRLLAFSTISHVGIMLIGLGLLSATGTAGMMAYLIGHGLVKGALFMTAGMLLALCRGIDELGLRGYGKPIWPAGIAMAVGGLLLGGAPIGIMDSGTSIIDAAAAHAGDSWIPVIIFLGSALTGGAVLRVVGRVFLGLGATPGEEEHAPTEHEEEASNRSLPLMLAPCAVLLLIATGGGEAIGRFLTQAVQAFIDPAQPQSQLAYPEEPYPLAPWLATGLSLAIAAWDLGRSRIPRRLWGVEDALVRAFRPLDAVHSGMVGDYVAWLVLGIGIFAMALLVG